jgi:hypothetical protein
MVPSDLAAGAKAQVPQELPQCPRDSMVCRRAPWRGGGRLLRLGEWRIAVRGGPLPTPRMLPRVSILQGGHAGGEGCGAARARRRCPLVWRGCRGWGRRAGPHIPAGVSTHVGWRTSSMAAVHSSSLGGVGMGRGVGWRGGRELCAVCLCGGGAGWAAAGRGYSWPCPGSRLVRGGRRAGSSRTSLGWLCLQNARAADRARRGLALLAARLAGRWGRKRIGWGGGRVLLPARGLLCCCDAAGQAAGTGGRDQPWWGRTLGRRLQGEGRRARGCSGRRGRSGLLVSTGLASCHRGGRQEACAQDEPRPWAGSMLGRGWRWAGRGAGGRLLGMRAAVHGRPGPTFPDAGRGCLARRLGRRGSGKGGRCAWLHRGGALRCCGSAVRPGGAGVQRSPWVCQSPDQQGRGAVGCTCWGGVQVSPVAVRAASQGGQRCVRLDASRMAVCGGRRLCWCCGRAWQATSAQGHHRLQGGSPLGWGLLGAGHRGGGRRGPHRHRMKAAGRLLRGIS